jgi:hypothetical protein
MPTSLFAPDFQAVLDQAVSPAAAMSPSPEDWRDQWIYFLMLDRFNNPSASPANPPFDDPNFDGFQGGKFSGVEQQLPYIKQLGAGAAATRASPLRGSGSDARATAAIARSGEVSSL